MKVRYLLNEDAKNNITKLHTIKKVTKVFIDVERNQVIIKRVFACTFYIKLDTINYIDTYR